MTTQEKLEAFAPYYPHELKVITFLHNIYTVSFDLDVDVEKCVSPQDVIKFNLKPILRPLSDLTKPCLDGGKVPIVELGKIAELLKPISFSEMTTFKGELNGVCAIDRYDHQWLMFDFKEGFSMWHKPHGYPDYVLTLLDHQLQLFQQLIKWHFWLGDQSEFGKSIIDINTIKTE